MTSAERYRAILAFALAIVLQTHGFAETAPPPDPRIQTVLYDAGRVYPIEVSSGYTLMIALGAGEHVETMAVGDSSAWQVTANKRGDAIFIKRIHQGVNTNLTVVTDTRTYAFELFGTTLYRPTPLIMRFSYPAAIKPAVEPDPASGAISYRLSGASVLRPSLIEARDNVTTLAWPKGIAVPAVFQVDADGTESLISGTFVNDRMIIQGVPQQLLFRSGKLLASATMVAPRKGRP
jgi:type IV secretion system protein VirB9